MTAHDPAPSRLVEWARELVLEPNPKTAGLWPRAGALLARQALEQSLETFWLSRAPGVELCSNAAQLTCLPTFMEPDIALEARSAWYGLSEACHARTYDLPPTAGELLTLIDSVERVIAVVASS